MNSQGKHKSLKGVLDYFFFMLYIIQLLFLSHNYWYFWLPKHSVKNLVINALSWLHTPKPSLSVQNLFFVGLVVIAIRLPHLALSQESENLVIRNETQHRILLLCIRLERCAFLPKNCLTHGALSQEFLFSITYFSSSITIKVSVWQGQEDFNNKLITNCTYIPQQTQK